MKEEKDALMPNKPICPCCESEAKILPDAIWCPVCGLRMAIPYKGDITKAVERWNDKAAFQLDLFKNVVITRRMLAETREMLIRSQQELTETKAERKAVKSDIRKMRKMIAELATLAMSAVASAKDMGGE